MRTRDGGFVLVIVLWVLAFLTILTLSFGSRTVLDLRAAEFALDQTQARYLARGAVERGIAQLQNKAVIDFYYNQGGRTGLDQDWVRPVDLFDEGIYTTLGRGPEFEKDVCIYRIEDLDGRISVNAADEHLLDSLEGLSRAAMRGIAARRRQSPGEDVVQPFQAIEELRYLDGVDDAAWLGEPGHPGLRDILSCWGDDRININTAPEPVLRSIPRLREDVLDAVLAYRNGADGLPRTADDSSFESIEQLWQELELSPVQVEPLMQYGKTDSGFFVVKGLATRRQGKLRAYCRATVQVASEQANVISWREGPRDE